MANSATKISIPPRGNRSQRVFLNFQALTDSQCNRLNALRLNPDAAFHHNIVHAIDKMHWVVIFQLLIQILRHVISVTQPFAHSV